MGPSQRSFNQVKSILSKLDRSIDEARQKRLHIDDPTPPPPSPAPTPTPSRTETAGTPPARPSPGRAQPLPLRPLTPPPQAQRRVS